MNNYLSYWRILKIIDKLYFLQNISSFELFSFNIEEVKIRLNKIKLSNKKHILLKYINNDCIITGMYAVTKFINKDIHFKNLEFIFVGSNTKLQNYISQIKKDITKIQIFRPFFQFEGYKIQFFKNNEVIATIIFKTDYCIPYFTDELNHNIVNIIGLLKYFLIRMIATTDKKEIDTFRFYYNLLLYMRYINRENTKDLKYNEFIFQCKIRKQDNDYLKKQNAIQQFYDIYKTGKKYILFENNNKNDSTSITSLAKYNNNGTIMTKNEIENDLPELYNIVSEFII